ncbi:MAG: hypothetical protein LBS88_07305 [Tannerellaceae bacterium]|jgi:hypothetical protein|nr:hypothetical protein [Tannerellaceae bacterium]
MKEKNICIKNLNVELNHEYAPVSLLKTVVGAITDLALSDCYIDNPVQVQDGIRLLKSILDPIIEAVQENEDCSFALLNEMKKTKTGLKPFKWNETNEALS